MQLLFLISPSVFGMRWKFQKQPESLKSLILLNTINGFVLLWAIEPAHGRPSRSDTTAAGGAWGPSAQCAQKREKTHLQPHSSGIWDLLCWPAGSIPRQPSSPAVTAEPNTSTCGTQWYGWFATIRYGTAALNASNVRGMICGERPATSGTRNSC